MKTKKILGLDLGTNSIGAALINMPESIADFGKGGNIEWIGSRIIPMDGFASSKTGKPFKETPVDSFSKGIGISKAAARRIKRGSRRLKQRYKLRRTRLIQAFKVLGWLDAEFPENFKKEMEDNNFKFQISSYFEFEQSTIDEATKFLGIPNKKGELALPEDWIIYYLRKKALTDLISIPELCRITYMMNQRRGFKSSRKDLKDDNVIEIKKVVELTILDVVEKGEKNKKKVFEIIPDNDQIGPWEELKIKKPEWIGKKNTYVVTWRNGKRLKPELVSSEDYEPAMIAMDEQMNERNQYPGEFFFNNLANDKNYKIRQFPVYRKKYKAELEAIWRKQIELNAELRELNTNKDFLRKLSEKLYKTQTIANKPKLNEILSNDLLHLISEDIIYYQRDLKSQKSSRAECQYEKHIGIDGETYGVKCAPKSSPEFQEMRMWQDIHNIKILKKEDVEIVDGKEYKKVNIDITHNYIEDITKEKLFDLFDTSKEITQKNIFDEINKYKPDAKLNDKEFRINMFFTEDKKLQGNETKDYFRKIFKKEKYEVEGEKVLNDKDKFYRLWNISYSISLNDEEKSKEAIFKALTKKDNRRGKEKRITFDFPENVAKAISSAPDIESTKKYASYSSKAINKLLPLMQCANKYNEALIPTNTKDRAADVRKRLEAINFNVKKINEIADDDIQKQLLKSFITKKDNLLKGLNTYQACYLVYDRHSERADERKYSVPSEFNIVEKIPNNSLRNPVVEQVIRETLFVVKDIWEKYGQPDEIHIEMGRDLKKNAKERESATKNSTKNHEERKRIKDILKELFNEKFEQYVNEDNDKEKIKKENVEFEVKPNPNNPIDIDKFRIWKNTSGVGNFELDELYKSGGKTKIPTKVEIKKYALWLSQKCVSPYTGMIIPLSKLFDINKYEIEHVLPKAKIKNDSFDNLVISEWGVNKAKGNELAARFINNKNGKCTYGNTTYKLLEYADYVENCKRNFKGKKLQNLLATEIPDDFISRQLNDTRYITKKIKELLYPVQKSKNEIIVTIGSITSELKREWGLNKVWKQIIKPRFERLEANGAKYIYQNKKDLNDIDFYIEENPDLDTKRIDHRHHALDALVIAATTIEHTKYLNSLNSVDTDEELKKVKQTLVKGKIREFELPWPKFTLHAKEELEHTIVTFKSYNKVIDKPKNYYTKWIEKDGKWIKDEKVKQDKNPKWMAVRESLFAEQPHGKVYIKEIIEKPFETPKQIFEIMQLQIKRSEVQNTAQQSNTSYIYDKEAREIVKKIIEELVGTEEEILRQLKKIKPKYFNGDPIIKIRIAVFNSYAAKRKEINKDFNHGVIDKIPYANKSKIPQALHRHLLDYEEKKLGIENLYWRNDRIEQLINEVKYELINLTESQKKQIKEAQSEAFSDEGLEALDKKVGMKIRMVTIKEDIGLKISLKNKLSEADGNPYYLMYENIKTKERIGYASLSSYKIIERLKSGKLIAESREGFETLLLQTNDLVYVPTKSELEELKQGISKKDAIIWSNQKEISKRIYRVNDFSGTDIYFKPHNIAKAIKSKELHTSFDEKCTRIIVAPEIDKQGKDITEDTILIKESCIKIKTDRLGNIEPFK